MDNNSFYSSIIEKVEQQKRDIKLSTNLFRYSGLIQAIEFFSQKLNLEQIIDAAFDFVNEILTLEKSAAFVVNGNECKLVKSKGYKGTMKVHADIESLQSLAKLHGTILFDRDRLGRYFTADTLEKYGITAMTPLIADGSLYAFILMSTKTAGEMNDDDYIISEALMRLINNSLENYKRYEDLKNINNDLDEKIFNLFAINQSSKALLSQLKLDSLYKLSTDVFSELTQSRVTGFVLYDENKGSFVLKGYKDVLFKKPAARVSLALNESARIDINKIIINTSLDSDMQYFNGIFPGASEKVSSLEAEYIVLLIKGSEIIGFVTLGKTVTGNPHKAGVFELIESLASATYIAISNAGYFKQVVDQKKLLDSKLSRLISLNKLVRNINSALNVETLFELTMKTMEVSFKVRSGLIALYDQEREVFTVKTALRCCKENTVLTPNKNWSKLFKGKSIVCPDWDGVKKYLELNFPGNTPPGSGMVMVPVYVERLGPELLGVIIVFKYGKASIVDEESLITLETAASHIAPVMNNLITIEDQKRFLLPNYIEIFKRDLKEEIKEALELSCGMSVVRLQVNRDFTFKDDAIVEKLKASYKKVYPFTGNTIFIIPRADENISEAGLKRIIGRDNIQVSCYNLGEDFTQFQDFFKLF